jgi:hypothetical protein
VRRLNSLKKKKKDNKNYIYHYITILFLVFTTNMASLIITNDNPEAVTHSLKTTGPTHLSVSIRNYFI